MIDQLASVMQKPYLGKTCDNCHIGTYELPESEQEWHVICPECKSIYLVYEPMQHQKEFHQDPHKYRLFAGGYGSAKTTTACMEIIDHVLNTPRGFTLIGAETLPQLEQTAMKEFFEVFPKELITDWKAQKNILTIMNGHKVLFRPLDEEQKARSLNLTAFWIEESNGVKYEYFTQLQTRLRNRATSNHLGILSSNPDMNWLKTEILQKADKIHNSPKDIIQDDELNKDISVHIAPTHLNLHLPSTFYEDTARGKPQWWVNRYLHGSFENKIGLVYPQYDDHVVDDFEIPAFWRNRIGGDFGLNNPTAVGYLATDPETGISYLYKEHEEAQQPVSYHASKIITHINTLAYGVIDAMVGDAAGQQKTAGDLSSVFDHYAEYGVYWTPSTKKLEDSIMKMYSYFDAGKLKIFKSCKNFLNEISQYRYPEKRLDREDKDDSKYEKPIAVKDHLLDAVRYVVAELPDDPNLLINTSYNAYHIIKNKSHMKQSNVPHALQDEEPSYSRSDAWATYY